MLLNQPTERSRLLQPADYVKLASRSGGNTRRVLEAIAGFTGDDWRAKVTLRQLQRATGFTSKTVLLHVAKLEDLGEIEVIRQRGRGHCNTYVWKVGRS